MTSANIVGQPREVNSDPDDMSGLLGVIEMKGLSPQMLAD